MRRRLLGVLKRKKIYRGTETGMGGDYTLVYSDFVLYQKTSNSSYIMFDVECDKLLVNASTSYFVTIPSGRYRISKWTDNGWEILSEGTGGWQYTLYGGRVQYCSIFVYTEGGGMLFSPNYDF